MNHTTIRVIFDEHHALATMLHSLSSMLAQSRAQGMLPDFDVLRAMLLYLDEFPERVHHKKESELLFPKLRERAPQLVHVLDVLDQEHANGEWAIRNLEHLLLAFEVMGEGRRAAFEEAVHDYIDFYLNHMAREESEMLPAAAASFSPADWDELDAAFAENRDPVTGHEPDDAYRPLFRKIVLLVPPPGGPAPLQ
jgi:hemerythrin-like domain-containing protein